MRHLEHGVVGKHQDNEHNGYYTYADEDLLGLLLLTLFAGLSFHFTCCFTHTITRF